MARILLVEDDHSVRDFVERALTGAHYSVMLAEDGGAAAAVLEHPGADFDLVLADIRMPVMDGIALALKVSRDRPDLPIVLMTGFADQRERARGLESIVAEILIKPFTLDQLLECVSRVLKGGKAA